MTKLLIGFFQPDIGWTFLVMKRLDQLKSSGVLEVADRDEAARRIRETMFGKYTKEQCEAAALSTT